MRLQRLERSGRAAARAGFTLMELLVVVAILVVLVGVATPLYLSYLESSKKRIAYADAVRLAGELKNFAIMNDGNYPPQGTWDLLPLERKPPLDPWGTPYQWTLVESPQMEGSVPIPIVYSAGPDRQFGDADDITSQ